jgi:hypothetical protein
VRAQGGPQPPLHLDDDGIEELDDSDDAFDTAPPVDEQAASAPAPHPPPPALSAAAIAQLTADVRAAETAMYARDLAGGVSRAVAAAEQLAQADLSDAALRVLAICTAPQQLAAPAGPRLSGASPSAARDQAQRAFRATLEQMAYGLPSTSVAALEGKLPVAVLTRLRVLRLRLTLATAVHSGDAAAILSARCRAHRFATVPD